MRHEFHKKQYPYMGLMGLGGGATRFGALDPNDAGDANATGTHPDGDTVWKWTSSGSFTINQPGNVDLLLVGGGGSGGSGHNGSGGGGGAGGLIFIPNFSLDKGSYTVTIGGNNGDSTIDLDASEILIAKAGGTGSSSNGQPGGSGSGSSGNSTHGANGGATQPLQSGNSGNFGFGNSGGSSVAVVHADTCGGGGGGAGTSGSNGTRYSNGGPGGNGLPFSIDIPGASVTYAGGGGGGAGHSTNVGGTANRGSGGPGGGGQGSARGSGATGGTNGLGGGGGGSDQTGGSGIFIIKGEILAS